MNSSVSGSAKILLIDANVFFARRVTDALKQEGFEVIHSTQSGYALTMLEYDTPSAIVCSTSLREINAHDLPPIVHADPKTAHVPVIALGEGGDQALMAAFRSGCADYLDKRLGPELIATQIKIFCAAMQKVSSRYRCLALQIRRSAEIFLIWTCLAWCRCYRTRGRAGPFM